MWHEPTRNQVIPAKAQDPVPSLVAGSKRQVAGFALSRESHRTFLTSNSNHAGSLVFGLHLLPAPDPFANDSCRINGWAADLDIGCTERHICLDLEIAEIDA